MPVVNSLHPVLDTGSAMRIASVNDVLETGGAMQVRKSTMHLSRKTFRMQIDSIYSDKPGAPVRELAANAFDSHVRAGEDKPFYVHVPTPLNPEFFVRDYGVGMTDELMETVYIVIGASDKELTNEEVGTWGLGSKSPFAYADQYTITCYDGEIARQYGYGIAEDGVPTLYTMAQEPNDQPRGVRVGFAVESQDFHLFETAVQNIGVAHNGGFETNIKLKGPGELVFEGADWQAYKNSGLKPDRSWWARQGCILYPIERSKITLPASDYRDGLTFIIDCPIGTVMVTPSREAIQYDEEVVSYLNERVVQLVDEVRDVIWEQVKDIKSVTEFFKQVTEKVPVFVQHNFKHPLTGLMGPTLKAAQPCIFFKVAQDAGGRWDFTLPQEIILSQVEGGLPLICIDDITPMLDPSRDMNVARAFKDWMTPSEERRFARFARAYLTAKNLRSAFFVSGVDWSSEFWEACFPDKTPTMITFSELRDAVPRRVAPPTNLSRPPIRGLALAKGAGEQRPVFEIKPDPEGHTAWVPGDQHRRQAAGMFKLAKLFNISALYIAAPQVEATLAEHGIPSFMERITSDLEERGFTFAEWFYMKDKLDHYQVKPFITLLGNTHHHCPTGLTRLIKAPGIYGQIAKGYRRYLKAKMPTLDAAEKAALDALLTDQQGKILRLMTPKSLKSFDEGIAGLTQSYSYANPTAAFVSSISTCTDKEKLGTALDALCLLQNLIPPNEKF
jgi:hypothetical protein